MSKTIKNTVFSYSTIGSRLVSLIKRPIFIFITVWGHLVILLGSFGFYAFEHGVNPKVTSYLDVIHWAVATVTTVGYGEFAPLTLQGKFISMFMMVFGSVFLWSYTALFTGAIVTPEIRHLMHDLHLLEKDVQLFEKKVIQGEEKTIHQLVQEIEELTRELKKRSGLS